MARFVHLHSHSQYSLLDGLTKIPDLVKKVKDMGMDAIAITDHGSLYGAIEFYKACQEAGIKPIIGCEMYIAKRSHKDKEGKLDSEPYHLTVLAKNHQGYLNLLKLISIAYIDGYYYRPRVDKELLKTYREGLIALSGCPSGEFIRTLDEKGIEAAEAVLRSYMDIFGNDFYLELQKHPYKESLENVTDESIKRDINRLQRLQDLTWESAKQLIKKIGIQPVATNDFHYLEKEDAEAQDVLLCVQTGKFLSETDRLRMIDTPDYYVKSPAEMEEAFREIPQAIENTAKIADSCELEIPLNVTRFPVFKAPEGEPSMDYLRRISFEKAEEKMRVTKEVKDRLDYELGVIEKKGYADYILVVWDFMNWAHGVGIITNTRGSAAASMVLYCLGVTNLNPLDYTLPFERFLTEYRPTLPDIDADLADDRRDEVIDYVAKKYGKDQVAHIVTFGTMMGRAAIRDVGRVMGLSYGDVDRIAKLIPPPHQGFHKPLADAIKEVPDLSSLYKNNPQVKKLLDLAVRIEATVRHASVHAAGIVIAPEELTKFTPLQKESNGDKLVTQYDMFAVEGAGLVKMDLLGIRNLSILGRAVEYVRQNLGQNVDLNDIPLNDKKAYELLARGETMGIFQLSSSGMTRYLVELKPSSIADIAAMVALYRPGPLGVIPEYIARKHNPKLIKYLDQRMEEYMKQSLGLLVYQEDVLYTAINLAGYSWEEADKFRKAMGKKSPTEMSKQRVRFLEGCIQHGMRRDKAEKLFALIAPFAAYGFNKAHAASYAMIAYQTAYMKANFPVEFMTAVMTAESDDTEKVASAILECKRLGIVVLPPDINKSGIGFSIEDLKSLSEEDLSRSMTISRTKKSAGIRFGLSAIKNVGESAIESILKAREDGSFVSLLDLTGRVDTRLVNRKTLESLIKAGAMDNLGTRASLLLILDQALQESHKIAKNKLSGQVSLFGSDEMVDTTLHLANAQTMQVEELPLEQLLMFEKDLLGFYVHEPPFIGKLQNLSKFVTYQISDLTEELVDERLTLGGVISKIKKVVTKRSAQEMAFVTVSDTVSEIDVVVFPKLFEEAKGFLDKDAVVLMEGKLDKREEELSFLVDKIELFDGNGQDTVEIHIPYGTQTDILQNINRTLRSFPGDVPVVLILPNRGNGFRKMPLPFSINPQPGLELEIQKILGEGSFRRM